EGTNLTQLDPLPGARRRDFALEEARQLFVQLDLAFALPHHPGRGIGPARVPRPKYVAAAQVDQRLGELAFHREFDAEVDVGLGVVLVEPDGLAVAGDGL